MSKRRRPHSSSTSGRLRWLVAVIIIIAIAVGGGLLLRNRPVPLVLPETYAVGLVTDCVVGPSFLNELGLVNPVIDTSQQLGIGLIIRETGANGRIYQHPTWDDAGNVGPFASDRRGHIYLAPAPLASLQLNPTAEQNKIYRVDGVTAEMSVFADLPWPLPPSGANPFGTVGLTYDCDTDSLYVSTVAGSTATDEAGRIYQLDAEMGDIRSQMEDVDPLGLGVFNETAGKRLFFGAARTPEVYTISLDAATGAFVGEPELLFSLAALPGGSFDNASRIQFIPPAQMIVKGNEFSFSLQVASDPQRNVYSFQYDRDDRAENNWEFQGVEQQSLSN